MWSILAIWCLMCFPMFFWANCPCCGYPSSCTADSCDMADCWEITVAGITDNSCTNCTNWNGTFTLTRRFSSSGQIVCPVSSGAGGELSYERWAGFCVSGSDGYWNFYYNSFSSEWILEPAYSGSSMQPAGGQYSLAGASFTCNDANDLSLAASGTACQMFPSTITVTPVSCP